MRTRKGQSASENGNHFYNENKMTKVEQLIFQLDAKLSEIQERISLLRSSLPSLKNEIREEKRKEQVQRSEKVGKFTLGQLVTWQENRTKKELRGSVIAIVPARTYPTNITQQVPKETFKTLRYRGYYRYEESYLVRDSRGKLYWPRTNSLTPLPSENNDE